MKNALFVTLFTILISTAVLAQTADTPVLRGGDAVKQLKQTGGYDSLRQAVSTTRRSGSALVSTGVPFAQSAKLAAAAGSSNDYFGNSVAISGRTAVVGAPLTNVDGRTDQGCVWVYVRVGTAWVLQAQLVPSDGAMGDNFGNSVSISGETIVVGAYTDDVSVANQGSAYVFVRNGTTWTQQAQLTASDGATQDFFGMSVAISGETILVGSFRDDVGGNIDQGSAYIFVRSDGVWTQHSKILPSDGGLLDGYGFSVALSGDTAVIGSYQDDVGNNSDQGSAYVYTRTASVWSEQAHLTAADGSGSDLFGSSIAIDGDIMIVGAFLDTVGTSASQGSAYIFGRSGTIWAQSAKLIASDGAASDSFGYAVSISGQSALVGSYADIVGASGLQGSAYLFAREGTAWVQRDHIYSSDGVYGDQFGYRVALSGDTAIIGASRDDINGVSNQGSAYIFKELNGNWMQEASTTNAGGGASDNFGRSVAISGDTAVVGAPYHLVGTNVEQGAAYVFIRSGTAWIPQAVLISDDGAEGDYFGYSVAIDGDTIVVGASMDNVGPNVDQGSAYIFERTGTAWSQTHKLVADDGGASDYYAESVAIDGDWVAIGAAYDDVGSNPSQGSVYTYYRYGTGWPLSAKLLASDGATNDGFGQRVALSMGTLVVSAPYDNVGANVDQGSAYVFVTDGNTWEQRAQVFGPNGAAQDFFGLSVDISGDTFVVGCVNANVGPPTMFGAAYVYNKNGADWQLQTLVKPMDGLPGNFGWRVSISGDTILVGANMEDSGSGFSMGAAYLFTRHGTAWSQTRKITPLGGQAGDRFGSDVAISGDKLVVGAPYATTQLSGSGRTAASAQGMAYFFVNTPFVPFDFDGDSKTDLSIFRPGPGEWWVLRSSDGGNFATQFGATTDKAVPADYTGDGKADVAFWRPSNGFWFVLRSEDFSFYAFPFGGSSDTPTPADFDGDGKTDPAVFRASNATWYIGLTGGTSIQQFGFTTDLPVPADYDGDAKADIAVFRPTGTNGAEWWIQKSTGGVFATQFGAATDKALPGDYTGDGKADIAFWRPSTGMWYFLRSDDLSFYAFPFGNASDIASPGDYDGDGRMDAGIFRPSTATWYANRSTSGLLIQQFGATGDIPVPNAFVR